MAFPVCVRGGTAVAAVLLAESFAAVVGGQGGGLFGAVEPAAARAAGAETRAAGTASSVADDITLRSRVVTIDFAMLAGARASVAAGGAGPEALTLNLFDDVVLTGLIDRTEPTFSGGYAVSGRIAGEPFGTITLVVNGETVAGTVQTLEGTYRIRSAGGRLYAISEVDLSKLPPLEDDVLLPDDIEPRSERPR